MSRGQHWTFQAKHTHLRLFWEKCSSLSNGGSKTTCNLRILCRRLFSPPKHTGCNKSCFVLLFFFSNGQFVSLNIYTVSSRLSCCTFSSLIRSHPDLRFVAVLMCLCHILQLSPYLFAPQRSETHQGEKNERLRKLARTSLFCVGDKSRGSLSAHNSRVRQRSAHKGVSAADSHIANINGARVLTECVTCCVSPQVNGLCSARRTEHPLAKFPLKESRIAPTKTSQWALPSSRILLGGTGHCDTQEAASSTAPLDALRDAPSVCCAGQASRSSHSPWA